MDRDTSVKGYEYYILSGPGTFPAPKTGGTVLHSIRVWAAGGTESTIELFDGSLAEAHKFDEIPGTAVGFYLMQVYCKTRLLVKVNAPVGVPSTLRARVNYL